MCCSTDLFLCPSFVSQPFPWCVLIAAAAMLHACQTHLFDHSRQTDMHTASKTQSTDIMLLPLLSTVPPASPPPHPLHATTHSWRSTPAPQASSGDRFASYSSSRPAASSGGSAGGSSAKLSASDLSVLRIDDLQDLVKKTGAQLPREPTKDGVISALVAKGVDLSHLTRGEWGAVGNKAGKRRG